MNPLLIKYPLDLTGKEGHNRIIGEQHDLSQYAGLPYRPLVLDGGYFYTGNLVLMDNAGQVLVRDVDYQVTSLNAEATELSGQEVCGVIVIVNPRVTDLVTVDVNLVGGKFADLSPAIASLADTLLNDTRSINWKNIRERPSEFPASGHLHPIWELFGFETYRDRIKAITAVILSSSTAEVVALEQELLARYAELRDDRDRALNTLAVHMANTSNPHQVTKAQVGLGSVENYPIASEAEARVIGGGRADRYMTPLRTSQNIEVNFGNAFNQHASNRSNPHRVTPDQVGAYSIGTTNTKFSTRLGRHEPAVASHRINGYTATAIYDNARANLPAGAVTAGRFRTDQLGAGYASHDYVLMGNGTWVSIASLLSGYIPATTPIYYIGYLGARWAARDHVMATYGGFPVGTIVMYHDQFIHHHYHNNGGEFLTNYHSMKAMARTSGGWIGPFSEHNVLQNRETYP